MSGVRLRKLNGEVYDLPEDAAFIEILDLNGRVASLIYVDDEGSIVLLNSSDPELQDYLRMQGLVGSKSVPLT